MSRTEERIRSALGARAGTPVVAPMSTRMRRRVRVRQVGVAAALGSAAVLALVVAVTIYGAVVRVDPRRPSTFDPAADGYTSPLEDVPPRWPALDVGDPADAYVPRLTGEPGVTEGPVVLVSGSVEGSSFTVYGYTVGRGDRRTPCLGFVGFPAPGAPTSSAPDVTTCADAPVVPEDNDLAFVGAGSAERPDLEANFGFVSNRVDTIYVWGGGHLGMFEITALEPLDGWNVSPFFFVPAANAGPIEVDARVNGGVIELAHADICRPSAVSGSCRTEVIQDHPLDSPVDVPTALAAGEWPTVTYGGEFTPYVDHEATFDGVVDPGVVGEKTVIAHGTVQGAPWSLVAYNARYEGAPDGISPSNDLFVTGLGGSSGGSLFNTDPWMPNDLSAGRMSGDEVGFDAIDGVVSPRVAAVRLEFDDGTSREVHLIQGPEGVDARYFVEFVPSGLTGRIVALDADGNEVEQMCLRDMMGVPPGGDPCS